MPLSYEQVQQYILPFNSDTPNVQFSSPFFGLFARAKRVSGLHPGPHDRISGIFSEPRVHSTYIAQAVMVDDLE